MHLDKYDLKSGQQLELFEFTSVGDKGRIKKLVQYAPTNYKDLYNLGFGDQDEITGEIDDTVISNNGDSEKVLATVVSTLYAFIEKHPNAMVYAKGSTHSRTRLYRAGITKYLALIKEDFEIYGQLENHWQDFEKDIDYTAFLVRLKHK